MNSISVIICTYLRPRRFLGLKKTLVSLSEKGNDKFLLEIIVVDNGGSISEAEKNDLLKINPKIRFVIENNVGLSVARNTGVRQSRGNIIAFVDDDIWVSEAWVENISAIYEHNIVLCAGGEVNMVNRVIARDKQWLTDYFLRFLFPVEFPKHTGEITAPYFLIGANMSFRKYAFEKYGFFDERLGRVGNKLISCEDTEFIARLPRETVFFVENAEVYGEIDKKRLTRGYMLRRLYWQGYSDFIFVQNVGSENFFDGYEVKPSWKFVKFISSKLSHFKLFEFTCIIARCIGFYHSRNKNGGK